MLRFKKAAILAVLSIIPLTACQATKVLQEPAPIQIWETPTPAPIAGDVYVHQDETWPPEDPMTGWELPTLTAEPNTPADVVQAASMHGESLELEIAEGRYLSWDELDLAGAAAGWEIGPWLKMRNVVYCETGGTLFTHAYNGSDPYGGSHGLAQMNGRYAFDQAGLDFEQRYDPVVNLMAAKWLWEARGGLFGGTGGWYWCSLRFGYD